jgi:hypothetical protein
LKTDEYKKPIEAFVRAQQIIEETTLTKEIKKDLLDSKFEVIKKKVIPFNQMFEKILGKKDELKEKNISDIYITPTAGPAFNPKKNFATNEPEKKVTDFFSPTKGYLIAFFGNIAQSFTSDPKKFYGVLEYVKSLPATGNRYLLTLIDDSKYADINDDEDYKKLRNEKDKKELEETKKQEEAERAREQSAAKNKETILTESAIKEIKDNLIVIDETLSGPNAQSAYQTEYFELKTLLDVSKTTVIEKLVDILGDDANKVKLPYLEKYTETLKILKKHIEGGQTMDSDDVDNYTTKLMEFQNKYNGILTLYESYAANPGIGKENATSILKDMISRLEKNSISEIEILAEREIKRINPIPDIKKEGSTSGTSANSSTGITKDKDELKKEADKDKDETDVSKEDWYKQLEISKKNSANYISNILRRIPPQYTNQLETVKQKL